MHSLVTGWRDDGNFHEESDKINRILKINKDILTTDGSDYHG
jgi:hypothetical protein